MRLRLPREHGTWGMFFVPFAIGWLAAGRTNAALPLLLVASNAVFFSRETLLYWWRARARHNDAAGSGKALALYAAATFLCGVPLLAIYKLYLLLPLAVFGVVALICTAELAVRRRGRNVATEFAGVVTASMNAATAHYAALGRWTAEAFWLWALCTVYFASSIFYVKLRVQDAHGKEPTTMTRARFACGGYHSALVLGLIAALATGNLPLLAAFSFTPVLVRAFVEVLRPSQKLNLRRIGWLEVSYSLAFLAAVSIGFARF